MHVHQHQGAHHQDRQGRQPDHAQDFAYTTTGSGLSAFTLDDDGAAGSATPNETTFTIPAAQFGSKSITEAVVAGWS